MKTKILLVLVLGLGIGFGFSLGLIVLPEKAEADIDLSKPKIVYYQGSKAKTDKATAEANSVAIEVRKTKIVNAAMIPSILAMIKGPRPIGFASTSRTVPVSISR